MIIRVCDVETCGLPPDDHQVVEVATVDLVGVEGGAWTRGRMWSSLVNPGRPIPPVASSIHHITTDMVKDAPPLDAVMEKVLLLTEPRQPPDYFAAHEAKFELACLPQLSGSKVICTRKCAATLWPGAPAHGNQVLRYWLGLKLADPSLAAPHRALGDAYVTAALLRSMIGLPLESGERATPELLADISSKPVLLGRLPFGKHAMQPCAEVPESYWDWVLANIKDDEDVVYTAKHYLAHKRAAQRSRSPV